MVGLVSLGPPYCSVSYRSVEGNGVLQVLEYQAFLKLFLGAERSLRAYLLGATGDVHAADDLLQSVACILLEKLANYDENRPFGGWMFGVARLEVLKWRQQAGRSREVFSEQSMPCSRKRQRNRARKRTSDTLSWSSASRSWVVPPVAFWR